MPLLLCEATSVIFSGAANSAPGSGSYEQIIHVADCTETTETRWSRSFDGFAMLPHVVHTLQMLYMYGV